MHFTTISLLAALAALTNASPFLDKRLDTSEGPLDSTIICGTENVSDAPVADCRAAIAKIDTSLAVATDPIDAIRVVTKAPNIQWVVVYEEGDCSVAGLTRVPLAGGAPTGSVFSGQETYDLANALLGCEDTSKGLVNGFAGVGQQGIAIGKI